MQINVLSTYLWFIEGTFKSAAGNEKLISLMFPSMEKKYEENLLGNNIFSCRQYSFYT